MRRSATVIRNIIDIADNFSGWLVLFIIALVFAEVFMRYVVGRPLMVADEFSAYMVVAIAYLGMAKTWKEAGHPRVTLLPFSLKPKAASWLRLGTLIIGLVFGAVMCKSSYDLLVHSFKIHMSSGTWLNTPVQGPQMTILIGFILLFLSLVFEIIKAINDMRSGKPIDSATGKL